jgi:non-ribosomal peptide synthetase component F
LRRLGQGEGVTLFMLLLAAFKVLLHRSTAQEDVVVGTAVGWRDHLEIEGLIGCFANMIPLRTSLAGNPSFRQLLRQVRDVCLDGFAHQELPFDRLIAELRPERDAAGRPPVPVAFGLQNANLSPPELPGLTVHPFESGPELVRFDLTLWVFEDEDGLRASWTYSSDLFEASTVRRLHDRFATLLRSIAANPEVRLQELAFHSEEEKAQQAAKQQQWEALKGRKLFDIHRRSARAGAGRATSGGEA